MNKNDEIMSLDSFVFDQKIQDYDDFENYMKIYKTDDSIKDVEMFPQPCH